MKKHSKILLLIAAVILIADNISLAQRFRMEEADNASIEVKFDAFRVNDQIQFVWNVNLESNIRSYEIIRGVGNDRHQDWEILNQVTVDRASLASYSFIDTKPVLGEMHYKLRLIAPDGSKVEYSPLFRVSKELETSIKKQ